MEKETKGRIIAAIGGAAAALAIVYMFQSTELFATMLGEGDTQAVAAGAKTEGTGTSLGTRLRTAISGPTYVVPAGTRIKGTVQTHISSRTAQVGDPVSIVTTSAVVVNEKVVIPVGTIISGRVTSVRPASETRSAAELDVAFTRIGSKSASLSLVSPDLEARARAANRAADAALVVGGAATGAIIGHQVDHRRGAERGAVVGGVAGAVAAANMGANVQLKAGEAATLVLNSSLSFD
jgi:hypothetical protein